MIGRICVCQTILVKWLNFIHNCLICTYKVTKIWSLDQIFKPLISLKIKHIRI